MITLQGIGKEMSSSNIHRQNTKQKKKKKRTTEHCGWQMLVEQDANCNQPFTKITGTDFVFYLENYPFALAAIFFFPLLLPRIFL